MSLKIEVESPRRDLVVVNYFHKLAFVKGESVAVESTLYSRKHRRQWMALGGESVVTSTKPLADGSSVVTSLVFHGMTIATGVSRKSPSHSAWITKRKLLQSNLSTGAEGSDSSHSSSFVSSQLLPLNKLISSSTFLLAWVKVFDHEIFQFYE